MRTISERIAEELGNNELVGYQVRFTDTVGKNTRIKLMTDGVLLAELSRDRSMLLLHALEVEDAKQMADFVKSRYESLLMEIFE